MEQDFKAAYDILSFFGLLDVDFPTVPDNGDPHQHYILTTLKVLQLNNKAVIVKKNGLYPHPREILNAISKLARQFKFTELFIEERYKAEEVVEYKVGIEHNETHLETNVMFGRELLELVNPTLAAKYNIVLVDLQFFVHGRDVYAEGKDLTVVFAVPYTEIEDFYKLDFVAPNRMPTQNEHGYYSSVWFRNNEHAVPQVSIGQELKQVGDSTSLWYFSVPAADINSNHFFNYLQKLRGEKNLDCVMIGDSLLEDGDIWELSNMRGENYADVFAEVHKLTSEELVKKAETKIIDWLGETDPNPTIDTVNNLVKTNLPVSEGLPKYNNVPEYFLTKGVPDGWNFRQNKSKNKEVYFVATNDELWKLPIYLNFGNFNQCPPPIIHAAIIKAWQEEFGAKLITMDYDTVEFVVLNELKDTDKLAKLTKQYFYYCDEVWFSANIDLHEIPLDLVKRNSLFCWWD